MEFEDFDGPPEMEVDHYSDRRNNSHNDYDEYESCWVRFCKGIRGFWATKHTEDTENNEELYVKTTLRELTIYLIYLVTLTIITFGMTNGLTFYFTQVLSQLFTQTPFNQSTTTFATSGGGADFWQFLTGPLLSGLYWSQWYNNLPLPASELNFIFYENKLIGLPRLRQVRVQNNSCLIASEFSKYITKCYASYSSSAESKDTYGDGNSTAWIYTPSSVLNALSSTGSLDTYGGGGYYVDLNQTLDDSTNTINYLFNSLWVDRGTRAVIIDFTIYNANINLFSIVKLICEFPSIGGMNPYFQFNTLKLIRYVSAMDYFVMACELLFFVFLLYYVVEEIIEIRKHRCSYFHSFWNCLDIGVICIGLMCNILNVYRTIAVQNMLGNLLSQPNQYPDFNYLGLYQTIYNYSIALTLFLSWIKLFKYISFNKTMSQLSETIGRCAKDLIGFIIMFLIIFLAFAQLGYLLFGAKCKDYNSFTTTISTLFRIILGDFDYPHLEQADRLFGPIYFLLYVFFVFFVLFNMFLAIINDTYSEVKADLTIQDNEFAMGNYLKQRANMMLAKLNIKRDEIMNIQGAMFTADANNDNLLDFDEWKEELKKRGFEDAEIEAVFARYDTDGNRVLDQAERIKMQDELEQQKLKLNNEITKTETDTPLNMSMNGGQGSKTMINKDQFDILAIKVDRMNSTVNGIVHKIDGALKTITNIEKVKSKKPETLNSLLNVNSNENLNENERKTKLESLVTDEIENMNQESIGSSRPKSSHKHGGNSRGKY